MMLGSTYSFSGAGWCITSVFFVLMVRPKLSLTTENLSTLFCMLAFVVAFSSQSSSNRNLLTISVFTLVEDRTVSAVSNVGSNIRATKCIKQHHRKHDVEKSGSQDISPLNPICDRKGYGDFSIVLHSSMHAVMELSNDGDEFFGAAVFCYDSPKAVSADPVKCLGQINISRVEVSALFLTLLLQLSCSKYHINSPTFLTEAELTLR